MEAPIKVSLTKLPPGEVLSASQWSTLLAIGDTVVPALGNLNQFSSNAKMQAEVERTLQNTATKSASDGIGKKFFEERAIDHPRFKELLERQLRLFVPASDLKGLRALLGILATKPGALILTGRLTPFHLQPLEMRQKIMFMWRSSCIPALRMFYAKMVVLCGKTWLCTSETFPELTGCPKFPESQTRNPSYKFEFIEFPADQTEASLDMDVVIVGSGCGGAVSAKNLAEAGFRVLVVEKAYHFSTDHFPMDAVEAAEKLFLNGGAVIGDSGSIMTIPGSTWGGGGVVNWSASLHTQKYVTDEWVKEGLTFFGGEEYQKCLDRVADTMGVSTKYINHNFGNQALIDGGRKLGYDVRDIPQNTGNAEHDCGFCTLGCVSGGKHGTAVTFLPDAAKAGAKFMQGFDVDKITFDSTGKRATGVVGTWSSEDKSIKRNVKISAKTVIISGGTMNSPLILKRSGLKNQQIGRNLHLHPVSFVRARYDEETRPWEGAIMTSLVDFGWSKLEVPVMLPLSVALMTPWRGGLDYKINVSSFHHWFTMIALTRDRDTGRIYPDSKDGSCRMDYDLSSFDTNNMLDGVIAAMKIHFIMGAREIASPNPFVENFIRNDNDVIAAKETKNNTDTAVNGNHKDTTDTLSTTKTVTNGATHPTDTITNGTSKDNKEDGINKPVCSPPGTVDDINLPSLPSTPAFKAWLSRLRKAGISAPYPSMTMLSAHQMGTCRMSTSPKTGVVNSEGKVWDYEGLYLADASVFPSASGVNPMLTTMGIADWISRGLVEKLKKEGGAGAGAGADGEKKA